MGPGPHSHQAFVSSWQSRTFSHHTSAVRNKLSSAGLVLQMGTQLLHAPPASLPSHVKRVLAVGSSPAPATDPLRRLLPRQVGLGWPPSSLLARASTPSPGHPPARHPLAPRAREALAAPLQVELRASWRAFGQPAFHRGNWDHQGDGICHCDSGEKPNPGKTPALQR